MKAEILTIGDEILSGHIVNTNAAWMGQQLTAAGIAVVQTSTVPDDRQRILTSVAEAMRRADLVLITGGLGPTRDDITKKALCDFFRTELVFDPAVYEDVKRFIQVRRIPDNPLQKLQAMVPRSCTVIRNRIGTAPGMWFEKDETIIVSMPGVPSEMKKMMGESVLPKILSRFSPGAIVERSVLVHGISESNLALKIAHWEAALPEGLKLASLPHGGFIHLRLTVSGRDESALARLAERERDKLLEIIREYVFDLSDKSPEALVSDILRDRGISLALIECGSGGTLVARIGAVPGSGLAGAAIAFTGSAAAHLSGTDPASLEVWGLESRKAAESMAESLRTRLGADVAVATSAVSLTPSGDPDPTLWAAFSSSSRSSSAPFPATRYCADRIMFTLISFLRNL
ncbi:MAG: CinA family protein [Desulfobacteraceae bacterium]|nr:CinA family protein [Desulfobacteraceae bacterium]